jgi:hypothetical protein
MRSLVFAVLLSATFVMAQDNAPAASQPSNNHTKGDVTVRGCVSRSSGDYILMKDDPGNTYELHGTKGIRLKNYLGQRVEVTGRQLQTLSTSSDALNKTGSASPITINVRSIKTIDKQCELR